MPSYLVSAKEAFVPTELYTPPIESIGEILRIKQSRYDQGFNQVNSMYRNIMDSEILSQHGNAKRKQFMDQADQAIKQLSNVDLSMPENVAMGENVFKPFWEDQTLVREIGVIKNTRKELSYAESLRTSTDEKVRADYNAYSVKDQQNLLAEIAESDPEDIKRIAPRAYTKNVNIQKEMDQVLKDLGMKDAQVREMPNGGGYKLVDQFGKESVLPLTDLFMNSLSTDARAYMQTMGRVNGRNDYEIALQQTNGDKAAARSMVADSLISRQRNTIEGTILPEFTRALGDAENKINSIIEKRRAAGSQLSDEDDANINQLKEAVLGYKKKIQESTETYKGLGDKNSELYQKHRDVYSTTNGYSDAYTSQIVSNFANGWAKSRAIYLTSSKADADQGWLNIENVRTARMNLEAGMMKTDMTNDVRLKIAEINAEAKGKGKSGATGAGAAGAGTGQPIYLGRAVTGNKPIDKFTQWATGYTLLSGAVGNASIRLFEKTLNERAGLTFTSKLYEGVEKGDGSKAFFTNKDTPEYKAFSKAIADGVLKLENGKHYNWTYNEVYDLISKNTSDFMKTDEGIQRIKGLSALGGFDQDAKNILFGGDIYNMARQEQNKIHNTIFNKDKYKGFTTSEGGFERLKTVDELGEMVTVPMRNAAGQIENISVGDLAKARNTIQTTSDNGVYVQGAGTTGRTYTSSMTINGQSYQFVSGSPKLIDDVKSGNMEAIAQAYNGPIKQKLEILKKEFDKEFEQVSPSLMFSQKGGYADMLNFGSLLYTSGDKNSIEAGEKAAIQLFGEENITNRFKNFIGVDPSDLKDGSKFMTVVNAVSAKLADLSLSETGPSLQVDAFNDKTGGAAYKVKMDKKTIMEALGVSAEALAKDTELSAAVDKFMSPEFKMAAPDNVKTPGDIIPGYSPIENYVQENGYKTQDYLDQLKIGGFDLKRLTSGGFQLNTWHYEMNPETKTLGRVNVPMGTLDQSINVTQLLDTLYNGLFSNYNTTVKAEQASNKVNGTVSLDNKVAELRNLGLNIK